MGADKDTGEIVALKRINTEQEENGFPITAIREVKILKALHHENIVKLREIVTSKGKQLVFHIMFDICTRRYTLAPLFCMRGVAFLIVGKNVHGLYYEYAFFSVCLFGIFAISKLL
jgi:serine/threonine protein kinase